MSSEGNEYGSLEEYLRGALEDPIAMTYYQVTGLVEYDPPWSGLKFEIPKGTVFVGKAAGRVYPIERYGYDTRGFLGDQVSKIDEPAFIRAAAAGHHLWDLLKRLQASHGKKS
jgi:hypothetical protein